MAAFLSVLLTILKIIGIVLLCIIGLVLFLVLLILFVPVRYYGGGFYFDKAYDAKVKATWLLHIISVSFDINREEKFIIKVFGFSKSDKEKKRSKKEKKKKTKKEVDSIKKEVVQTESSTITQVTETSKETSKESKKKTRKEKKEKKDQFSEDSKDEIKEKLQKYFDIINTRKFDEAFSLCKKQIRKLLKAILPKRWRIEGKLGFDDPSTNGKIAVLLSVLYPFVSENIKVKTSFEEEVIHVNCRFRGRIFIVTLVYVAIRIYFNKNIKALIGMFKEENDNG